MFDWKSYVNDVTEFLHKASCLFNYKVDEAIANGEDVVMLYADDVFKPLTSDRATINWFIKSIYNVYKRNEENELCPSALSMEIFFVENESLLISINVDRNKLGD